MQTLDFPPEMFEHLVMIQPKGSSQDQDDDPPARGPLAALVLKGMVPDLRMETGSQTTGNSDFKVYFPDDPDKVDGVLVDEAERIRTDTQIIWLAAENAQSVDTPMNCRSGASSNGETGIREVLCDRVS